MTTFLSDGVWKRLKEVCADSRRAADVAVAYFGRGAADLLPLPEGSRLLVDASEEAVKSGQTHPDDLAAMVRRGVRVYSVANLHAKVFVFGGTALVGSANASRRSADTLIEAVVATTDREAVMTARQFVRKLCLAELGPEELSRLQSMYRPPKITGIRSGSPRSSKPKVKPEFPRMMLAQLEPRERPKGSESAEKSGRAVAKKHQERPRKYVLEDFWWSGQCPYKPGDIVVKVMREAKGRRMVSPPGKVVYMRRWHGKTKACDFVYLELPRRKRMALDRLARRLGPGAKKRLLRRGQVSAHFAEGLLAAFKR